MSDKAAKRQKFCASCFNYINSCDCLGNLDDHAHLTDFEVTGKDDDEPEESDDVWYFRAEIGPTLLTVGNIGLMGLLSMKEMWTTDPPANPSLYLSIPKDRLPMSAVNVNVGQYPSKPEYIAPQHPWEIPFFKLKIPTPKSKTDEEIDKDYKDCLDKAGKKKGAKFKCLAKYLWEKAQQKLTVTEEDLKYAVSKAVDVSAIEGYYGAFVFAKPFVPPRLWNAANNSVVPGCGHGWIEQDLIDGGDPAKDLDCSGFLISNVPGAEEFWNDNQTGTNMPNPYDGGVTTPFSQARMLTMPHVPPPVPRDDVLPCSKLQYQQGKCEPPDDPPPPYLPPPISKPPPTVIVPPEPPVDPPTEPPLSVIPDYSITPNAKFGMAIFQLEDKRRNTWYNSGTLGFADDRCRPHLAWGSSAVVPNDGTTLNQQDQVQFRVPPSPVPNSGNTGPFEWGSYAIFCMNHRPNPNQLFQIELIFDAGVPATGQFEFSWDNGVKKETKSGASLIFNYKKSVRAGIDCVRLRITPKHRISDANTIQDWKMNVYTNWDVNCKPIYRRASALSGDFQIADCGGPAITYDSGNGRMILTNTTGARQYASNVITKPPQFGYGNGEFVYSVNICPNTDNAQCHKCVNTGDGGLTPVMTSSYFDIYYIQRPVGIFNWNFNASAIPGSFSGYFGQTLLWSK